MKRTILIISTVIICSVGFSQGITNNWIMGYGPNSVTRSLFNFSSGSLAISQYNYPMQYKYTNSTISDNSGNLLFSVNGYYIADATGDTMMNGSGLNPSFYTTMFPDGLSITQANLIIPKPGSSNLYYLFHSTIDIQATTDCMFLYLSEIDMTGNGGLGEVVSKNTILINDNLNVGKITSCKHANGRDWWVFCHKESSNIYYSFLVTPYNISGPFTQAVGINRSQDVGQMEFSPDGTKFAIYWPIEDLEIFDFDRCTGSLSNPVHIILNDSASTGGVAFSPNSQFLYVTSTKYVYQFDVTSANIPATKQTVAVWDGFYSPSPPFATLFVLAQLAPDGKIYISTGNGGLHLHVINQPDSLGFACDLVQHGIQIPHYYFNTLPNHPNYFLGSDSGSVCDSLNWTGLANLKEIEVSAYPNPFIDIFSITYPPMKESGEVSIYDITGKVIFTEPVASWSQFKQIDVRELSAGIYFLNMKWGSVSVNTKMIKKQ